MQQRLGPRRLLVVMMADLVGYSRMMHADERGTLLKVSHLQRELVMPLVAEHHGTVVKLLGDGFFASFDSPVEAVRCAIVIQNHMVGHNLELPKEQWLQYRIGINLGDVIVDDGDIYGDGVNIAARLEQLAEPGSIYVSGAIYEQVKNRLVCAYQSLGDRKVKNITDPVTIYRVLADPRSASAAAGNWRTLALIALALALGGAGGGYVMWRQVRGLAPARVAARPVETGRAPGAAPLPVAPAPASLAPARPGQSAARPAAPPQPRDASSAVAPYAPAMPPSQAGSIPATSAAPAGPAASETVAVARMPQPPVAAPADRPPSPKPTAAGVAEPEMVLVKGGAFRMGSREDPSEQPEHVVEVPQFWLGKYPVTVGEWQACAASKACPDIAHGAARQPVTNVSWNDTASYLGWLSKATGRAYRLLSEAEWEYAARGGTTSRYWWGNAIGVDHAACKGCGSPGHGWAEALRVGQFAPNPFGLFDLGGLVAEWVADCWHPTYAGAPKSAKPWTCDDPRQDHVLRGGSWMSEPGLLRVSDREHYEPDVRYPGNGFRVARSE